MKLRNGLVGAAIIVAILGLPALIHLVRSSGPVAAQSGEPAIVLYSQPDFQGRSLSVTASLADLPKEVLVDGATFDWNDNVGSVRVVWGTWRLYQNGRFNTEIDETPLEALTLASKSIATGWSCLVSAKSTGEVRITDGAAGGWGSDVSSLELVGAENLPDWALAFRVNK